MRIATLFVLACIVCSTARAGDQLAAAKRLPLLHTHPTLQKMLGANNRLREQRGLRGHRISAKLTRAAQDHAWYMARTGVFSHHANGGLVSRGARHGYHGMMRENIASGQRSVGSAFSSWRSSGGHWASIISNTTHAGFGYAISPSGQTYWVGVYGNDAGEIIAVSNK